MPLKWKILFLGGFWIGIVSTNIVNNQRNIFLKYINVDQMVNKMLKMLFIF